MGNSWTNDTADADEDTDEAQSEESKGVGFVDAFESAVHGDKAIADISEMQLLNGIDEVDDEDLLREGWLLAGGEKQSIIENRLEDLGEEIPSAGETQDGESTNSEDQTTDSTESSDDSDGGWGGSDDDSDEESEEETESDSNAAQPEITSVEEMDEQNYGEDEESAQNESSGGSEDSGGPPTPTSAVSVQDAADRDRRWKVMVWGPPKLFKTHFCYTMPGPIAYLDLEGKADDLAKKFKDKEVQIWQPKNMEADPDTKFRRAKKALDEAFEWLDWYRENEGQVGTIVVDSMSLVWEWAQIHHKIENYPLKDPEDIDLSANFQSSQESDWAVVKEYHNGEFRERITDSDYHFCWTAMERVDFERQLDDDSDNNAQFMEPRGESTNHYKADTIIRARKDNQHGKVGDLVGSNFTDNVFVGMEKPTFPKVKRAIENIEHAEATDSSKSRQQLADEIDAETIIDYDPQMYVNK